LRDDDLYVCFWDLSLELCLRFIFENRRQGAGATLVLQCGH